MLASRRGFAANGRTAAEKRAIQALKRRRNRQGTDMKKLTIAALAALVGLFIVAPIASAADVYGDTPA